MEKFEFTDEQKEKLLSWKSNLDTDRAKHYLDGELQAIQSIRSILIDSTFKDGADMTSGELDNVFKLMKKIAWNRALARNLYEKNGLEEFNKKLRILLFGKEPLQDRINEFVKLKGVHEVTMSHFLCAFDHTKYPLATKQTYRVLGIDEEQAEKASKQTMAELNITDRDKYKWATNDYFVDLPIYREIKNILNLENYAQVNHVLWRQHEGSDEDTGEDIIEEPTYSVTLESDLRDHLAKNPHLIEQGLKLVQTEKPLDVGRADILLEDADGNLVVVETKKGASSDKVIGQILRYMGSLGKSGKKVRGIIVVNEPDERLNAALLPVKDLIKLKYYKVKFELSDSYNET